MSTTSLRRRGFGKVDNRIEIHHPDAQYFKIKTTQPNQTVGVQYADYIKGAILDGEQVPNSQLSQSYSGTSGVIVPEPGIHDLYVFSNGKYFYQIRVIGLIIRTNRIAKEIRISNTGVYNTTTIIFIGDEMVTVTYIPNKTRFPYLKEILVPKSMEDVYKNSSHWAAFKDIIQGVEFNIIED